MLHGVDCPAGLSNDQVSERTQAARAMYDSGAWSRPFYVASLLLTVEVPACPLSEWMEVMERLRAIAEDGASADEAPSCVIRYR